jgi:hypothetical protein
MARKNFLNNCVAVAGLILAGLILAVSIMRSAQETAYAFAVNDELRGVEAFDQEAINKVDASWRKPGSTIYGAYAAFENIRSTLTWNGDNKASLFIHYANERVEYAEEFLEAREYKEALIVTAKAVKYLTQASQQLEEREDSEVKIELEAAVYVHESVLIMLDENAVDGEKDVLKELSMELEKIKEKL